MTPKMAAVMATASLEQGAQGGAQRPGELKNKYLGTFAQRVRSLSSNCAQQQAL
jgi:uncharacterized protein YueI